MQHMPQSSIQQLTLSFFNFDDAWGRRFPSMVDGFISLKDLCFRSSKGESMFTVSFTKSTVIETNKMKNTHVTNSIQIHKCLKMFVICSREKFSITQCNI